MQLSALAAVAAVVALAATGGSAAAASYVPISGTGSTWQYPAINQWSVDVVPNGLTVSFTPVGSAAGRADYIDGYTDFAVSDVPFRNGHDKLAGTSAEKVPLGYSYIPALAGGIAFLYNLPVHGRRITGLRLSAATLMGIFTGQITNWDSPQITRDNGRRLPNLPITPVVHAEEAGTTSFFTNWLARMFPRQWNAFCARVTHGRVKPPCGPTTTYPASGPGWHPEARNGSHSVANAVSSRAGSIGYDEYAYALPMNSPVAQLRNPDGRYVLPAPQNVTQALTRAVVNENPRSPDFLQENLDAVYTYKNPLSYPLSYYGYWIVPRSGTTLPPAFTQAKGRSLSTFLTYGLCRGQQETARLGYAPLPRNLVQAGLQQVGQIPGHVTVPPLSQCDRLPVGTALHRASSG